MSHKLPSKPRKNAQWFYQDRILVDKEKFVWIATGPYRKDLCGKSIDGVIMYYNRLKELYEERNKNKPPKIMNGEEYKTIIEKNHEIL